jgi:hypothetical protein
MALHLGFRNLHLVMRLVTDFWGVTIGVALKMSSMIPIFQNDCFPHHPGWLFLS